MYKKILKADYKFEPPFWNNISENAKVVTCSIHVYLGARRAYMYCSLLILIWQCIRKNDNGDK